MHVGSHADTPTQTAAPSLSRRTCPIGYWTPSTETEKYFNRYIRFSFSVNPNIPAGFLTVHNELRHETQCSFRCCTDIIDILNGVDAVFSCKCSSFVGIFMFSLNKKNVH